MIIKRIVLLIFLLIYFSFIWLLRPLIVYCPKPIVAVSKTTAPVNQKTKLSLSDQFGQNLVVGIPYAELDKTSESILREVKPAGIVLYQRNFTSFSQVTKLISQLQEISKQTTKSSYFIMLDEEPDGANRMGLLKDIFPLGNPDWRKIENDIGILAKIGINVELAPLADFPFLPNSFISKRIPFRTKENMMAFNKTFITLLKNNQLMATLKHFPGLGLFSDDPHQKYIQTDSDEKIVEESMKLFQSGIDHGAQFVMTSHAQYDKIDPDHPSTFSKKIVTEYLQQELGFKGITLTDDLSDMPLAIEGLNLVDAGENALKAGHNLIMFSHQLPRTKEIIAGILLRAEKDPELRKIIEANFEKICSFKEQNLKKYSNSY